MEHACECGRDADRRQRELAILEEAERAPLELAEEESTEAPADADRLERALAVALGAIELRGRKGEDGSPPA